MNGDFSFLTPPYIYLTLGVVSFLAGAVFMCTGVVWARFGRVVYRAENPREFWENVVVYYIVAVCCIGYFLYKIYGL